MKKPRHYKSKVTRRSFVKGAVYGSMGIVLGLNTRESYSSPPLFTAEAPQGRVILMRNQMAVENGKINSGIVSEMVDLAVRTYAGENDSESAWRKFFTADDTVGIKITKCGWMRIHTDEAVVDAIKAGLQKIGIPKKRIIAQDGGLPAAECTALINVPAIKIHTLTGIASSLKNYINFSEEPSAYHHNGSTKLGEIWLRPEIKDKTRLVIVDALRPYFGPGPQINPMHRWDYKGIMVSQDPVAVDAVSLKICQEQRNIFKGEEWPISPPPISISAADTQYNLGVSEPSKIRIEKLGWSEGILIGSRLQN